MLFLYLSTLAVSSLPSSAKVCFPITIPVYIEARQATFDQIQVANNIEAVEFSLNFTSIANGGNYTKQITRDYQTVSGHHNISAKFCHPGRGIPRAPVVQFLIHGIGFDKSYWDLPFENYSYTDVAVDEYNFCTLAIDRFGIGQSSQADPINVVQAPASMSAIYQITQMLRTGTIADLDAPFSSVVHIGHSFGAFLSYLLVINYPKASDGLILTGFSFNGSWFMQTIAGWNLHVANLNQPFRFGNASISGPHCQRSWCFHPGASQTLARRSIKSKVYAFFSSLYWPYSPNNDDQWPYTYTTEAMDLTTGYESTDPPQNLPASYLTWSDLTAAIYAFLYPPAFDISLALYAEATKQPVTLGELLTIGNALPTANDFTSPVQIVTGRQDNIYCGGDCLATGDPNLKSIPAGGAQHFPNASVFETYVQEDMGHGMNFHYNASGYYRVVNEFLVANGLHNA